MKKFILYILIN